MVSDNHYLELYINNELVELESQKSLNLRINNVLWNPTKTTTKQSEYSYSFSIPSTRKNDQILDYANNLAKLNKFHTRYKAEVYADGNLIFDGSLTIKKFDLKKKEYNCNLVNIKFNTLEELFGEEVLSDVKWMVDYQGVETINNVNADKSTKYWFPFVSYGAFQKKPISTRDSETGEYIDDDYWEYTSKYNIDRYNRFYLDNFYPSLNALEEIKKCFQYKGYTVGGNAFNDPILSNIYCSTNLADDQNPTWNIGNPKFGKCELNIYASSTSENKRIWESRIYDQELKFPYFLAGYEGSWESGWEAKKWNFNEITYYNLLNNASPVAATNMYHQVESADDDSYVKIPADGWYKISLHGRCTLTQDYQFYAMQWLRDDEWRYSSNYYTPTAFHDYVMINPDLTTTCPIEIQLVKNDDDNLELIKGKYNLNWINGRVAEGDINLQVQDVPYGITYPNRQEMISCYPHEQLGSAQSGTSFDNLRYNFEVTDYTKIDDTMYNFAKPIDNANLGYVYKDDSIMCYDEVVSPAFICGWTTMGSNPQIGRIGTTAFKKNGYSWSKTSSDKQYTLYNQQGYWQRSKVGTTEFEMYTRKNENTLLNAPTGQYVLVSDGVGMSQNACLASVNGCVYLKKDDILKLMLIRRCYRRANDDIFDYNVEVNIGLEIEAVSPRNYQELINSGYNWLTPTEFPYELNLMNFTSNETKISDWLKNMADAFNLEYEMNGNTVDINVSKGLRKDIMTAVNIDDRVSSDDAIAEYIEYPKEMSVKYKVDTEEHGFYKSVPQEYLGQDDWKNYGESGYTVIKLNDDSYVTTSQNKQTQFSYTWYDNFTMTETVYFSTGTCRIPVIEKEEYMIDEINFDEAMAHRGYNLSQRFWFRQYQAIKGDNGLDLSVEVKDEPRRIQPYSSILGVSQTFLYAPVNSIGNFNLSYKDTERSLVTDYFDIYPMLSSNYVTVETFLTPTEYIQIKGGALVQFDDDLYYTSEISGYDPSSRNITKLKLVKKI